MAALLTKDQEKDLILKAQAGDDHAVWSLIESNMGLCRRWAAKSPRPRWMDLEDLVNEGVIGLKRAIELFKVDKGFAFSTYAVHWIRQAIQRKVEGNYYDVYTPTHIFDRIGKIDRARKTLHNQLGREPTMEEVSAHTGISREHIVEADRLAIPAVSLDELYGDNEDLCLGDIVTDDKDYAGDVDKKLWVADLIDVLPDRLKEVITLRYGLNRQPEMTLADIARMKGCSRELIRQLETKALKRLRKELEAREKTPEVAWKQ